MSAMPKILVFALLLPAIGARTPHVNAQSVPPATVEQDFSTMTDVSEVGLRQIGGFFYDCQGTGGCPGGVTAKTDGGVTLEDDPTYGKILRMHQRPDRAVNHVATVKGRFNVPPDSAVWFQSVVRFAPNWNLAVQTSYKYNFFYLSTGGTMRLQKCCPGPGTQMTHGFGGGTPYGGRPPLRNGSIPGDWISSCNCWVRVTGWFVREGADITSGWLLQEVDGNRHTFHGGKSLGVPQAIEAEGRARFGSMVVYRVSQGENINEPPREPTHIDYASVRVWAGVKDPLGLLNSVR